MSTAEKNFLGVTPESTFKKKKSSTQTRSAEPIVPKTSAKLKQLDWDTLTEDQKKGLARLGLVHDV